MRHQSLVILGSLFFSYGVHADVNTERSCNMLVVIDPAFTPEEQGQIGDALEHWILAAANSKLPIHFQVQVVPGCHRLLAPKLICLHRGSVEGMPADDIGLTVMNQDRKSSDIWVKTWEAPMYLTSEVFQHEIGHALGLGHTGAQTVMCFSVACASLNVTLADIQQWELISQ